MGYIVKGRVIRYGCFLTCAAVVSEGAAVSSFPLIYVAAGAGAAGLLILAICMAAFISCLCCCCNRYGGYY